MVEVNLLDEKKKALTFKEYYTYVFVQTNSNFYNGYICQIDELAFIFLDDEIPQPFPIRWDSLKAPIVPSKKDNANQKLNAQLKEFVNSKEEYDSLTDKK